VLIQEDIIVRVVVLAISVLSVNIIAHCQIAIGKQLINF
jgi:hypothetical protein